MTIQIQSNMPVNTGQSVAPPGARATTARSEQPAEVASETPSVETASSEVNPERLHEAVETINRKLQENNQQLQFSVDLQSGKTMVKVVDTATDQLIRQIPSEVAIAISHSLEKLQGLLVRQHA